MVAATHIATEIAAARVAPVVGVLDAAMVAAMVVGAGAAPVALGTTGTRIGVIAAGLVALAGVAGSPSLRRTRAAHSFDRPEQPPVGATS